MKWSSRPILRAMHRQIFVLSSLLVLALAQSGGLKCGGSWQQLNDRCFLAISGSNRDWSDARIDCQNRAGADLAIIPDLATTTFLQTMMSGVTTSFWIGLHDIAVEDNFHWVDDETPDDKNYKNWAPLEPNDGGWLVREDCVEFDPVSGQWNDEGCSDNSPYICERDVTSLPSCDESNGWRSYNGKCYQFFYDFQPWAKGQEKCAFYPGGHIAFVKSAADQTFLDNLQITHGYSYWIGLHDGSTDGEYQWSDKSTFDNTNSFQNWDKSQPNNKWYGKAGDCGAVTNKGLWTIRRCAARIDYVCEIPEGTCPQGWHLLNGNCFQVNTKTLSTWTDAKVYCEAQLAYLTAIKSDVENNLIKSFLYDMNMQGINQVYIGVSDLEKDGTYVWTDGSFPGSTYTHWLSGQPPDTITPNNQKDCGYISTADIVDAQWLVGDCFTLAAFICETKVGSKVISAPTTPITSHCDGPGWDLHKDICYDIVQTQETWSDARTECQKVGGDLISIHNDDVQSFMAVRLNSIKQPVWLGLNEGTTDDGIYEWSDGTPNDYSNWAPSNPGNADCVRMEGQTTSYGLWTTRSCTYKYYYACQKKAIAGAGPTQAPPPTVDYLPSCGTGWEFDKKSDKCYLFKPFDYADWFQARYNCRELGGDLMSLSSNDDLAYATGRLMSAGTSETWIGCNDLGMEGGWVWSDKKPFALLNWAPGQPDNWYGSSSIGEHCCSFYNTAGTWNDLFCESFHGYSCNKDDTLFKYFFTYSEKKLAASIDLTITDAWPKECAERCLAMPTTQFYCRSFDYERSTRTCYLRQLDQNSGGGLTPTFDTQHFDHYERNIYVQPPAQPTPIPANKDCPKGWGQYHEYCYYASFVKNEFNTAEAECQKLGAEVASIKDMNVNNFVRAFIYEQNPSENQFWIGLNDRDQEMLYEWSDREPVTFINWNAHEPNDAGGEDCTEMYVDSGFWNDVPCQGDFRNSICRKLISTGNPDQPSDTTCPSSGNWEHPWRDRCYQFDIYSVTWKDAVKDCTNSGGQLVVIEDRMELAYLSGALGLMDVNDFYIAFSDSNIAGYYEWNDGTPITFTNWGEGQPDHQQGQCITMNSDQDAGYWTDRDCGQKYRFICEQARSGYPPITQPTSVLPTTPTDLDCATGWVGYGSRCFQIFEFDSNFKAMNWDRSNQECNNMGATLASFHHPDEEDYLIKTFNPTSDRTFWIGLNDQRREGGYAWSDGTQVEYTNWAAGEPNDYGGREECVETNFKGGKWNDQSCYKKRNFICAIPKGQPLITTPAPTIPTGDECPDFPEWIHLAPNCYYFSTSQDKVQDWHQAEDFCHGAGAQLVSIHDNAERNFINARLAILSGNYWTGLRSNVTHPGEHKWSDQTLLDYKNWQPNQPDTQNGEELCVQMKGSSLLPLSNKGQWLDANCGLQARFVCKKNVDGTAPTHAPTHAPTGGCEPGWVKYGNDCFMFMGLGVDDDDPKKNWQDARETCSNTSATLASIHNADVQMYLTTAMVDYGVDGDAWIGMSSLSNTGKFLWADSSSVDFVYWVTDSKQTQADTTNPSDCVSMVYEDEEPGKWDDDDCSRLNSYLCKKPIDASNPDKPVTRNCTGMPGYTLFGDDCFKVYDDATRTFQDARKLCQGDGAEVASVLNGFEQAKLHTMVLETSETVWIGLRENSTTGMLSWVDGWPLQYDNWGWSDPKNLECAVMKEDKLLYAAGEWANVRCTAKFYTACKYSTAIPPTPFPTVEGYCDQGWTAFGASCYQVGSGLLDQGTFGDAIYDCEKNYGGSYVATISSKAENSFILNLAQNKFLVKEYYIGIDRTSNGGWEWVDGSPLSFVNWASDDADSNANKNCAEVRADGKGKWYHIDCKTISHYVCEKPIISLITTKPPFNPPPCPSGSTDWKLDGASCYFATRTTKSWKDGEAWCNQNGGYLASVHSYIENDFIKQLTPFSFTNFWIGYTKLYDGTVGDDYRWTDQTNPSYEAWADGEPNDHMGAQKCAEMMWDGTWDDTNCGDEQGFVCKRDKDSTDPIVVPPPLPTEGNCPQGWTEIETGCYRIRASTADFKTWDDARAECQKVSRGDLASIHDQGVQSLLTSFIKSHSGHMWIGLRGGTAGWWGYHWVDQSNVDYEYWAVNQPSFFYDNTLCVVMVNDPDYPGRWDDIACSEKHGYLCFQPLDPSLPTVAPPSGSCDLPGYEPYFEDCFKLNPTRLSFDDARKACESDGAGAALATVRDGFAEAFIVANMLYAKGVPSAWIGFTADNSTGTFKWVDEWPDTYTNWSPYNPTSQGNCVIVKDKATWVNTKCDNKYPFICRTTTTPFVRPTDPPSFPGSCAMGWIPFGDSCYMFGTKDNYSPWYEAEYRCAKDYDGAHLVSIHSKAENAFIQENVVNTFSWSGVWLDLTRNETASNQYEFLWNDGSPVDYTNWKVGALGSSSTIYNCAVMMPKAYGKWETENCAYNNRFVCNKPKVANPVGGCEEGWLRMDNWCYGAFGMFEPQMKTWVEAEKDCNDKGGNLATVYGQNVQSLLEAMFIFMKRSTSAWIGLNKMSTGFYEWADGTPFNFQHWDDNSPDDNADYKCVYMWYEETRPGFWKNGPCADGDNRGPKESYFCQKAPDPSLPVYPTGQVCSQDGYFRYGDVCYKVYGTPDQLKPFGDAEARCESDGATLPSVTNGFSEAFMETLLYYYDIKDAWIGLMKNADGDFVWLNNDTRQYLNWDDDEPSNGASDNCARISNGQKWDAVPCDAKHNFICQILEKAPPPATTTSGPQPPTTPAGPQPGKQTGLSGGAIAGVIISVLVAVILSIVIVYFLLKSYQAKGPLKDPAEGTTMGFDNVLYTSSGDDVAFDAKAGGARGPLKNPAGGTMTGFDNVVYSSSADDVAFDAKASEMSEA